MARILNTVFNPLSFEEINTPLLQATQAHQALEEQYGVIADKAAEMEKIKYNTQDADVYADYLDYQNSLQNSIEDLARNGLNVSSRSKMLGLRQRYQREINPMELAYKERDRQAKLQQEMALKDPTYMFGRDANSIGLREFMKNPQLDALSQNYSGAYLQKQVSDEITALARDMVSLTRGGNIDSLTYKLLKKKGFTASEIQSFINDYSSGKTLSGVNDEIFKSVIDNTIQSSGMTSWENWDKLKDRAYGYAFSGLKNGVGESDILVQDDKAAAMRLQSQLDYENYVAKKAYDKYLEQQTANDAILDQITQSSRPFLQDSNVSKKDINLLDNTLTVINKDGKRVKRAAFFGKNGQVDPFEAYEEYKSVVYDKIDEINKYYDDKIALVDNDPLSSTSSIVKSRLENQRDEKIKEAQKAGNYIFKKYGVSKIMSTEQADILKSLGYTHNKSKLDLDDMYDAVNKKASQHSWYSINASDYSVANGKIKSGLLNAKNVGSNKAMVYEVNKDGTKGKMVKISDLNLAADDGSTSSKNLDITDIGVYAENPDKMIIEVGKGKYYYIDPIMYSTEAANLFREYKPLFEVAEDKTVVAASLAAALYKLNNSPNPVGSKTSSKAPGAMIIDD